VAKLALTEADTCRIYVLPAICAAGWTDEQIREQQTFTPGRIIVAGGKVRWPLGPRLAPKGSLPQRSRDGTPGLKSSSMTLAVSS
jgi:hypothetical protein